VSLILRFVIHAVCDLQGNLLARGCFDALSKNPNRRYITLKDPGLQTSRGLYPQSIFLDPSAMPAAVPEGWYSPDYLTPLRTLAQNFSGMRIVSSAEIIPHALKKKRAE
jgi:hypothetical protein